MSDNNKKNKSLVERYGIYQSPFGDKSAFNQESSLGEEKEESFIYLIGYG